MKAMESNVIAGEVIYEEKWLPTQLGLKKRRGRGAKYPSSAFLLPKSRVASVVYSALSIVFYRVACCRSAAINSSLA